LVIGFGIRGRSQMSADNYIFVDKKNFEVWHCIASELMPKKGRRGLEKQKTSLIGRGKDLIEALEIAEKANDWTIEYGIHFKLWCK